MQSPLILPADDEMMREIIKLGLETNDFRVTSVANGRQTLIAEPELGLTDLDLPAMNGLELLRHFKSDAQLRHIPPVLLSNHAALQPLGQSALATGAAGYIAKARLNLRRLPALLSNHRTAPAETEAVGVLPE